MVCLMFVGFRMRVLQLTKGTGNPQDWVRMSMQAVTYSILANTLMVMLIPLVTAKEVKTDPETGVMENDGSNPFASSALQITFNVIRYVVFLGLYVGFAAVSVRELCAADLLQRHPVRGVLGSLRRLCCRLRW